MRAALLDARKELAVCLRECADNVRGDCARWIEEVERAIPSLSVTVRRGGAEVQGFALRVDGVEQRDLARSIELDPGTHEIVVEVAGEKSSQSIVVVEGEKFRRVAIELRALANPASSAVTPTPGAAPARDRSSSPASEAQKTRLPLPWQTVVFGAVGLAGTAMFGGFALYGNALYSDLEQCRPRCGAGDVATTRTIYRVGDVALGVGVVSLAVATVFYVIAPGRTPAYAAGAKALSW